jgi:uncharacterized protein
MSRKYSFAGITSLLIVVFITLGCEQRTTDAKSGNNMNTTEITREKNISSIKNFFEWMHTKKLDEWDTLWAEDGFIYIPYPVLNFPDTIKTKKTISEGFRKLFAGFKTFDYKISEIYPSVDPDIIVVEYTVSAVLLKTDAVYNGTNLAVFKFRNGKILAYHDYFNPEKFKMVVENIP